MTITKKNVNLRVHPSLVWNACFIILEESASIQIWTARFTSSDIYFLNLHMYHICICSDCSRVSVVPLQIAVSLSLQILCHLHQQYYNKLQGILLVLMRVPTGNPGPSLKSIVVISSASRHEDRISATLSTWRQTGQGAEQWQILQNQGRQVKETHH